MSLGQISDTGKKSSKLYMVECSTIIDGKTIRFYFYSTKIISSKSELREYLRQRNRNNKIGVFGSNYVYQSNDFVILSNIKADPDYNSIYLAYYLNDGNGWRVYNTGTITFDCYEM